MQRLLGWSSLSADFRGDEGLACSDKSDPCLLRDFWSKTTVQRQTSAKQEQIKPFRKALPGSLPALPSGKPKHQPAGPAKVCPWRHFLFMFSFTGPTKLRATEAVPQLHPHHSGTYLHRHSIPAAHTHKKKACFEAALYSLKAQYRTEISEKGKQTVLFHVTPTINIPVLAKHL